MNMYIDPLNISKLERRKLNAYLYLGKEGNSVNSDNISPALTTQLRIVVFQKLLRRKRIYN